jgi:hypothetical protein
VFQRKSIHINSILPLKKVIKSHSPILVIEGFLLIFKPTKMIFELIHLLDDVNVAGVDVELDLERLVDVALNVGTELD